MTPAALAQRRRVLFTMLTTLGFRYPPYGRCFLGDHEKPVSPERLVEVVRTALATPDRGSVGRR